MTLSSASIGKNAMLSTLGNLAMPLSTVLAAPMLARALGVDGRGELAGATAPLMMILTVATFGIPEALTVTVAQRKRTSFQGVGSAALILASASALGAALMFAFAPLFAGGNTTVQQVIQFTSLAVIPSVVLGAPRALAIGMHRWNTVNLEKFITGSVRLIGTAILFWSGTLNVLNATLFIAIAPILGGIAYFSLLRIPRERDAELVPPTATPRQLTSYGLRVWLGSISGVLLSRLSQVIMLPLAGPAALGQFAVAMNVADVSLLANNAVRDVTMAADATDRSSGRLTATARISFLLSLVLGLLLAFSLPLWFGLVFGEEFNAAIPAATILIFTGVFGVPGSIAGAGLTARGRPELRSIALFIALFFNVTGVILLSGPFGATGAAIATFAGSAVASNLNILFMHRLHGTGFGSYYLVRWNDVKALVSLAQRILRKEE